MSEVKVRSAYTNGKGQPLPVVLGSQDRVNNTAGAVSAAELALPTGSIVIEIRALDAIWLRFGNAGMGEAAADSNSILFPAGEKTLPVPLDADKVPYTHFRTMRAGANDVAVQIERVE